jgi:hypothetical protein
MNQKKDYILKLAVFLENNGMKMSGEELAKHFNRNNLRTSYGTEYKGGRGTYKLIRETYHWLKRKGLLNEADKIAKVFVKPDGSFAY